MPTIPTTVLQIVFQKIPLPKWTRLFSEIYQRDYQLTRCVRNIGFTWVSEITINGNITSLADELDESSTSKFISTSLNIKTY